MALHRTPPLPCPVRVWVTVQAVSPVSAPVGPLYQAGAVPEGSQIMKSKPYLGYWLGAVVLLILGLDILITQLTSNINPAYDRESGSYREFLGGMYRGDEGMNIHDTTLSYYAFLIYNLFVPYLLIAVGLWLGIAGYRRRKSGRAVVRASATGPGDETVWPPPPTRAVF